MRQPQPPCVSASPPLLLDDREAVAVAIALRLAAGGAVAGVGEHALRALTKLDQVMPGRLRERVADVTESMVAVAGADTPVEPGLLLDRVDRQVAVIVSGDTCDEPKPSVKPMFYACEQMGVEAQRCFYVGDAERDMQAGKNAGMTTVLADWGYISTEDQTENWFADFRIATPLDLLAILR